MTRLPPTKACFACGAHNPAGLHLEMSAGPGIVRAEFVLRPEHAGFAGHAHGGILATALDELMAWACIAHGQRLAWCADLQVRFLRPLKIGDVAVGTAELTANKRGKLFEAKGEIQGPGGQVVATSTGRYLALKPEDVPAMTEDFLGDATSILKMLQG